MAPHHCSVIPWTEAHWVTNIGKNTVKPIILKSNALEIVWMHVLHCTLSKLVQQAGEKPEPHRSWQSRTELNRWGYIAATSENIFSHGCKMQKPNMTVTWQHRVVFLLLRPAFKSPEPWVPDELNNRGKPKNHRAVLLLVYVKQFQTQLPHRFVSHLLVFDIKN